VDRRYRGRYTETGSFDVRICGMWIWRAASSRCAITTSALKRLPAEYLGVEVTCSWTRRPCEVVQYSSRRLLPNTPALHLKWTTSSSGAKGSELQGSKIDPTCSAWGRGVLSNLTLGNISRPPHPSSLSAVLLAPLCARGPTCSTVHGHDGSFSRLITAVQYRVH